MAKAKAKAKAKVRQKLDGVLGLGSQPTWSAGTVEVRRQVR
ncbi:hypothetical protein [Rhodococcus sp. IEGM 1305]|nr:hypothetical protein [Rhodococcus sp. IEGM 1305]MDI9954069.1 hypothetical protein [Rhodococcus sp. IEGM 1305]